MAELSFSTASRNLPTQCNYGLADSSWTGVACRPSEKVDGLTIGKTGAKTQDKSPATRSCLKHETANSQPGTPCPTWSVQLTQQLISLLRCESVLKRPKSACEVNDLAIVIPCPE